MKKLIFTLIGFIYGLCAYCQATQQGMGSVEFPEPANKATKEQVKDHIARKFDNDQVLMKNLPSRRSEHQFVIKDVLIYLVFTRIGVGKKVDLTERKREEDLLFGNEKDYSSEMKNINGNMAYVSDRITSGNIETFAFLLYKSDGAKVITGRLDFQKSNKETAKNILDYILTHAKFKD